MPTGIIIKGIGGFYYVAAENEVFECKARGVFRKKGIIPLPGDRVSFLVIDVLNKTGSVDEILTRESQLIRPAVANVSQVVIVIAVEGPCPDFSLLDKLLITAGKKNISSVICINKIDLDHDEYAEKIANAYKLAGYKIIKTSSKTNTGYDLLEDVLRGNITVFAGQSGVGKSTILNSIMKAYVMETGDISKKINRGKHTTRHAELFKLDGGGYVVDTPGFSSFNMVDIQHDELQNYYPEFQQHVDRCRFSQCIHISEPSCGVKHALGKGLIDSGRYERYIQMFDSLKNDKSIRKW